MLLTEVVLWGYDYKKIIVFQKFQVVFANKML